MIQHVLPVVVEELNAYLKNKFNAVEDKVALSNIIDQDGSIAVEGNNKIIATLVSIERDLTYKASATQFRGNSYIESPAPVHILLTVMFSALFNKNHYMEALKYTSGVIYFFQNKPLFTPQNSPRLAKGVDKLYFDLMSLSTHEMMNIYSMLGAKYMPSVVYKIRMLSFNQDQIISEVPMIKGLTHDLSS
jgi:hypothetical protein